MMDVESTLCMYICINLISLLFMGLADSQRKISVNGENNILSSKKYIRVSTVFMSCSFFFLYFLLIFRNYVGTDYAAYVNTYQSIGLDNLYEGEKTWLMQSPLFFVICKSLYVFTDNYIIMFATIGFITLFFFYKSIHDISINWMLSLYLLICFCLYYQAFNQIRQMTAVAIIAYSYRYLVEDNLKKFFITMAIATSFHLSAVIFCLVWFVRKKKISIKYLLISGATCVVIFLFFNKIQNIFSFLGYLQTYANDKSFSASFEISTILNFIVRLVIFCFCLLFYRGTIKRAPYTISYYNIAIICTVLQVGAIMFNIFGRVTTYFYISYLFLIPEVLKTLAKRFGYFEKFILYIIVAIAFAIYFIIYYFSSSGAEGSGYLNYSTWL